MQRTNAPSIDLRQYRCFSEPDRFQQSGTVPWDQESVPGQLVITIQQFSEPTADAISQKVYTAAETVYGWRKADQLYLPQNEVEFDLMQLTNDDIETILGIEGQPGTEYEDFRQKSIPHLSIWYGEIPDKIIDSWTSKSTKQDFPSETIDTTREILGYLLPNAAVDGCCVRVLLENNGLPTRQRMKVLLQEETYVSRILNVEYAHLHTQNYRDVYRMVRNLVNFLYDQASAHDIGRFPDISDFILEQYALRRIDEIIEEIDLVEECLAAPRWTHSGVIPQTLTQTDIERFIQHAEHDLRRVGLLDTEKVSKN